MTEINRNMRMGLVQGVSVQKVHHKTLCCGSVSLLSAVICYETVYLKTVGLKKAAPGVLVSYESSN